MTTLFIKSLNNIILGEAIVVTKGTENKNENFKDEDDKEGGVFIFL